VKDFDDDMMLTDFGAAAAVAVLGC